MKLFLLCSVYQKDVSIGCALKELRVMLTFKSLP